MWHQVCLPLCVYRKTFFSKSCWCWFACHSLSLGCEKKILHKKPKVKEKCWHISFLPSKCHFAKYDRKINKLFSNNVLAVHFDTRNSRNLQVTKINFYGSVASIIRQERIFLLTTHNHSTINIAVKSCTTFNRFTIKNSWNIQLSKVCSKIDSPYDLTEWTPYCVLLQSWCNWILENK